MRPETIPGVYGELGMVIFLVFPVVLILSQIIYQMIKFNQLVKICFGVSPCRRLVDGLNYDSLIAKEVMRIE